MRPHRVAVLLLIALSIAVVFIGWALLTGVFKIRNNATIKAVGVEVYWDSELTLPVTNIDWGFLEPAENKTVRIYIKSIANVPSTLNMTTENWQPPEASNYISLSWNYNGIVLNPNDVLPIDLALSVSAEITGITNFSFDIVITAIG